MEWLDSNIPKYIIHIKRQGTWDVAQVQDIVSAIAKAWNNMSPRLHQIKYHLLIKGILSAGGFLLSKSA